MTVEEIIIELERAWNAGDGVRWAASFSEDADFVDVVGRRQHDREMIAKEHQRSSTPSTRKPCRIPAGGEPAGW